MTNYDKIKDLLEKYLMKYDFKLCIESNLHDTSINKSDLQHISYLYDFAGQELNVIDMDAIAQKAYRLIKFPESQKTEDSIASADAFLINRSGEWFFVEFKDQDVNRAKDSVTKKAYQNWHWLLDILYEMKLEIDEDFFDFDNPIEFAKQHVTYILVVSKEKNGNMVRKFHECILAGEKYKLPFMEKLEKYIFKEAYAYTPEYFMRVFVRNFQY